MPSAVKAAAGRGFVTIAAALLLVLAAGVPEAAAQFETPNRQFHDSTTFRLDGRHRDLPCESCHRGGQFKGTPNRCLDCHWVRRQDDRYRLELGSQCGQCHRTTAWTDTRWDHAAMTGMSLGAAHRTLSCQSCHAANTFRSAQGTCVSCHQKDYQAAQNPNHAAAGFPTACDACHKVSDTAFQQARFDHQASFPLAGPHAQQACAACHRGNRFLGTPRDCAGCHLPQYQRTSAPNHAASGFPMTCDSCHRNTDSSWSAGRFNHNEVFPLAGPHAQAPCTSCHVNGAFRGTTRECIGCHRQQYEQTTAPNHAAAGFPTTCETCHRPSDSSWRGRPFNHTAVFPLVGMHAQQACASCHVNSVYRGTPRDCAGCHRPAYERTTAPNHAAAGFPLSCETCHRPDSGWRGAGFNHGAFFPLVGRHAQQACAACHVNNVYRGIARECVGCHRAQYDRTTAPNHAAAGFPTACESCHRADTTWGGAGFNHAAVFALQGRHAQAACSACHVNNVYRGTARDCVGCHRAQYDRTSAPSHASAGFPTACANCHRAGDASWSQGTFNHRFPIASGPHRTACSSCHQSANYQAFTCLTCHEHSRARMDDKHKERAGYRYDSLACIACHPNGRS